MSTSQSPLSAAERRAWRAAGWLMTGACGALTVWGFGDARRAVRVPEPVVAVQAQAPAAMRLAPPAATSGPAAAHAHRRGCGRRAAADAPPTAHRG